MIVLSDTVTGVPVVVEVSSPRTRASIIEASAVHLVAELDDGRVLGAPVRIVMTLEVAAALAGVILGELRQRAAFVDRGEVAMPVTHDIRCDCGAEDCPSRPTGDAIEPD